MNSSKSTSENILHQWLTDLHEKPSRIVRFNYVELDELSAYIKKQIFSRLDTINDFLPLNPNYSLEWAYNNITQFGWSYNRLNDLQDLVIYKMKEQTNHNLNNTVKHNFRKPEYSNKIFRGDKNKDLFYYCLENITFTLNRKNVGGLFSWFSPKLNCTKKDFSKFWNRLDIGFNINIDSRGSASFDNADIEYVSEELNSLEDTFNKLE